ncbi:hypothetical protein HYH03_005537 [Edaphochlamys debaryana]|uniref:Uncharacterized protein n=1 Tax=Edaphochlamys debaryana TaxID=47281 RepID=A0A835Y705_9CHLO|nr:hypothetical protein HYH03_005537 [Edaphochlamys debaryana]|eukprot:KAG2496304.1 hypothetical protein HYH03_005537 [Edaphochlamys debaryana]
MAEYRDFPPLQRHSSPSLEDVLHELDLGAADIIVRHLGDGMLDDESHHLANARLTCRASRDLVDGSSLRLHLKPDTISLAHRPSLGRWPRVNELTLDLRMDSPASGTLSTLLVQPFVDQPEEARRLISSVYVLTSEGYDGGPVPAPVFMQLSSLLPQLHQLNLEALGQSSLACTPVDLRLMYAALSSLPHLESLGLPTCAALPGIEALAGSLKHLPQHWILHRRCRPAA